MDQSVGGSVLPLSTRLSVALVTPRLLSRSPGLRALDYGDFVFGDEISDERDTVSPATPGRPEDRATPVVLSTGTVCVGVCGRWRVVS
jgi:hypothetical protein